jgi:malonyl-CoA O-methyltransferase
VIDAALTKQEVRARFSKAATTYDTAAMVQRQAARKLSLKLKNLLTDLPDGPLLELGCGTGFMSRHIAELAGERPVYLTDLSPAMLEQCRENLADIGRTKNLHFDCMDADTLACVNRFAAVVCSFSFQWFAEPESCLARMLESLKAGGYLLVAYPTSGSFPEWQQSCRASNRPYSGNLLPDADCLPRFAQLRALDYWSELEAISAWHKNARSFFESLRATGADFSLKRSGHPIDLLRIVRAWDKQCPAGVAATYEVCYGWIKKGGNRL